MHFLEWVALTPAMWLWGCDDILRMWYLPTKVLENIGALNVQYILGGLANKQELYELLPLYSVVDWENVREVPLSKNKRRTPRSGREHCPGCPHPICGDWVSVNLERRE